MGFEDETRLGSGDGGPRRLLKDIERPFSERKFLENHGEALMVNRNLILAYKFLRFREGSSAEDTMFVARERTIPVKIVETGLEKAFPKPEMAGRFGVLCFSLTHPITFFVGEDYKISFAGRTESDKANRIVRFTLESTIPIIEEAVDGELKFDEVLRQYYLRRPNTARQ